MTLKQNAVNIHAIVGGIGAGSESQSHLTAKGYSIKIFRYQED
jgi:hypothetical protein